MGWCQVNDYIKYVTSKIIFNYCKLFESISLLINYKPFATISFNIMFNLTEIFSVGGEGRRGNSALN